MRRRSATIPEKDRVFSEAFRVLKPGGHLLVSDIVAEDITDSMRQDIAAWASCVSGAVSEEEYLGIIKESGFESVEVVDRVDYDVQAGSEPSKISSIRVSAAKPTRASESRRGMKDISNVLDIETQLLISVGSAVAAGCIPCLEGIVEKARAAAIDEKKLRAAARTGQFVKDQPASHMKAFADELLGTHLSEQPTVANGCAVSKSEQRASSPNAESGSGSGGCGCS